VKRWLLLVILLGPIALLVIGTLFEIAHRAGAPRTPPALTTPAARY
jgi:hypothetical protein